MHEMLISKQPILIHCHQGVSRSAALVIGYLMKIYKMTCHDAYNLVKDRAPSISPNVSLIAQLVECEKKWIG
ncbi:dual specificity phosphatase [Globomyces pollinis-pini]|nr:dual specificity phosphatase [Globomyces pollinis-pini]